jgi:hypothetical protein
MIHSREASKLWTTRQERQHWRSRDTQKEARLQYLQGDRSAGDKCLASIPFCHSERNGDQQKTIMIGKGWEWVHCTVDFDAEEGSSEPTGCHCQWSYPHRVPPAGCSHCNCWQIGVDWFIATIVIIVWDVEGVEIAMANWILLLGCKEVSSIREIIIPFRHRVDATAD